MKYMLILPMSGCRISRISHTAGPGTTHWAVFDNLENARKRWLSQYFLLNRCGLLHIMQWHSAHVTQHAWLLETCGHRSTVCSAFKAKTLCMLLQGTVCLSRDEACRSRWHSGAYAEKQLGHTKVYLMARWSETIRSLGSANVSSTGYGERSHVILKDGFRFTNKHSSEAVDEQVLLQCIDWN